MPKFVVDKSISFESGHRLLNYDGRCKNFHGHNYICTIKLENYKTDNSGFVVDFSEIKEQAYKIIDLMDHAMILNIEDSEAISVMQNLSMKYYTIEGNPTAENIAKHIYCFIKLAYPENIKSVSIEETPDSVAKYEE